MSNLCKYAREQGQGRQLIVCNEIKNYCGCQEYCEKIQQYIMKSDYKERCTILNNFEPKQKEQKEHNAVSKARKAAEEKQSNCTHDYVFDTSTITNTSPEKIYGACKKCGKQINLTVQQYEKEYGEIKERKPAKTKTTANKKKAASKKTKKK